MSTSAFVTCHAIASYEMKARIENVSNESHTTTLLLAFAVWLCVLPIVLSIGLVLLGWQGAVSAAMITLIAAVVICHAICYFPQISNEDIHE